MRQTLKHYRFRPIERCHYRFPNFASRLHIIYIIIFQISFSTERLILSAYKYSTYILRGWNEQFSIGTKAGKGWSWTFVTVSNILPIIFNYLPNFFWYFRSSISPWRGPQWKTLFQLAKIHHQAKNQHSLRPPLAFPNLWRNICILFSKYLPQFWE